MQHAWSADTKPTPPLVWRPAGSSARREGTRASSTAVGYEHALDRWEQLHGDIPVADIRKAHALQFRQALQEVPRGRSKALAKLTLPELVEWRREHPSVPSLTIGSVNKLMAGVQALAKWAHRYGLVPDDRPWADPFSQMKLASSGEEVGVPSSPRSLRGYSAPRSSPRASAPRLARDTAFWLPLLALFTGCRRSELAKRKAADITQVESQWCLLAYSDKAAGQNLKTTGSARTIPILVRLGFLEFVRSAGAQGDWLFPAVISDKTTNTWTQWFGRYLDRLGLGGCGEGFTHCS